MAAAPTLPHLVPELHTRLRTQHKPWKELGEAPVQTPHHTAEELEVQRGS